MLRAMCLVVTLAMPASGVAAEKWKDIRRSYAGTMTVEVDASDVQRRVYRVTESIPVAPGPLTLYYPEWIPGNHAPTGRPWQLSGLQIAAAGKDLAWRRDPANMFAFVVEVPKGVREITAKFQYVSALVPAQGPIVVTPELLMLRWSDVVLYPAGVHSDGIRIRPSAKLPPGWRFATSLEVENRDGDLVHFAPVSLTDLVDSPLFAGRHARKLELEAGSVPVNMQVFADVAENLAAEPEHVDAFRAMVRQGYKLFGAPPYKRYELLLALHDNAAAVALEHQSSTEIRRPPGFFTKWKTMAPERPVFPHEFVHVWIGKKHRSEDLATPHYNVRMENTLLWSYEGEAEYWAQVLSVRSGLLTHEQGQQALARIAGYLGARAGRSWRNLQDTTNEPIIRSDRARDWTSWQRGVDYYGEGVFLWLEADARIRELSGGSKSLDDFARAFHGGATAAPGIVTYTFDDVVKALDAVVANDWRAFLRERLESNTRDNAAEALKAVGWRVVFKDKPSEYMEASDREAAITDVSYSLGLSIGRQDAVASVTWDGPAFNAGLAGGGTLIAVNGRTYKADALKAAITASRQSGEPIELLVKTGDVFRTVSVPYKGGLRYPHLERIPDVPDRLTAILTPLP